MSRLSAARGVLSDVVSHTRAAAENISHVGGVLLEAGDRDACVEELRGVRRTLLEQVEQMESLIRLLGLAESDASYAAALFSEGLLALRSGQS